MKKHYSLLFAFFMAFLSLLVSCDEIENYKITIISTEGGKAEIYGTIETSVYVPVDNWIQVSAISDDGYGFVGWFIGDDSEPVSTEEIYVFFVHLLPSFLFTLFLLWCKLGANFLKHPMTAKSHKVFLYESY